MMITKDAVPTIIVDGDGVMDVITVVGALAELLQIKHECVTFMM